METSRKQEFLEHARMIDSLFIEFGGLRIVEGWSDDVPEGKVTDFRRAVQATDGESVVFSWMTWPSREVCDAASEKMQNDESMKMPDDMPFNPQRMIYAGFEPVLELGAGQGRTDRRLTTLPF